MRIFLTGATGFVGSEVLERLTQENHEVLALVRKKLLEPTENVKLIVADLSKLEDISSEMLSGVNAVVHTAARAHVMKDETVDLLEEYRKVNRDATLGLANLAEKSGVQRFVYISSVKVNGELTRPGEYFVPDAVDVPSDPYGLSKYEAELGLLEIARKTEMEVVIIRPPLVYGPDVKGNFASMVNLIKKGIPLPFGAIFNQRSLIALDNLVDFIALCADRRRSPKAANHVFLVSDGEDVSTSQLLRRVGSAYGVKSRLLPIPVGLMELLSRLLGKGAVSDRLLGSLQVDITKTTDLLGWKPVVTMNQQLAKMAEIDKRERVK